MVECKTYLTVESFCNEFNCRGGIGLVTFPQVDSRQDLWEVRICDSNLLHILLEDNLGLDDDHSQHLDDLEHDLVAVEMHDTDPDFTPGKFFFRSRDSEHIN